MAFLRGNKRIIKIALLILLGILLIIISSFAGDGDGASDAECSLDKYRIGLEEDLKSLCHSVEGVGRCKVFITLERGEQNTYRGSSVVETKPPKVLGVTVVCDGADRDSVKRDLTDMCTSLFGIGSNRVAVLKLNS